MQLSVKQREDNKNGKVAFYASSFSMSMESIENDSNTLTRHRFIGGTYLTS